MFIPLGNISAGAIAGIAVGAVIAIIIIMILIIIFILVVKRRRSHIPAMHKDSVDNSSADQGPRLLMYLSY